MALASFGMLVIFSEIQVLVTIYRGNDGLDYVLFSAVD